jgi:hypothetical protein
MRLRNLFEASSKEVAIIFGRFNPAHQGHKAAWETAATKDIWYVGTNESTVGPKDPLPFNVKVEVMQTIWPDVKGHIMPETSWLTLASYVYKKHGKVSLVCVTDESWVVPTIQEYNGKEGPHGFYEFPEIRLYHDSIEEAKLALRKSSATSLRDAVAKGDRQAFSDAAGVSADTPVMGKPFFDLVAEYLMPYVDKAKAKADKAKAKIEKPKKETKPKKDKEDMKIKDLEKAVAEGKTQKQEAPKPRNFVAKNAMATTSGAGAHKDKKKAMKQGEVKHKGKVEMAEAYGRSSSYHGYLSNLEKGQQDAADQYKRDFKRREMEHELGDEEEYYQRQVARQRELDRGPWYIRIDGRILTSKGEKKVFDWKKGANNYALAILKNKPELQGKVMLTKNPEDNQNG